MRILLVTSRGSGRWIIPKGTAPGSLLPHAAVAIEAEKEAGVIGAVCPTPLGSYRFRKRRANGAALMVDVDVFPLAVTEEQENWKEQDQRERRWFSLTEAAEVVSEQDLRDLIRSFDATAFRAATRRSSVIDRVAQTSRISQLFGWIQRLLPKSGNFFEMFEAHAQTIVASADALARLFQGGAARVDHICEINEREHDADNVIRQVLLSVRKTFLTPFDRSTITSLISSMDDAVDEMQAAAGAVDLYDFNDFEQEMRDMTAIIVDAARVAAEAIPLLRDVAANDARLHELTERLVRMEGQADEIHEAGVKKAFYQYGAGEPMKFIVVREIYKHLERIVDALEDVANEIDGIVIEHA